MRREHETIHANSIGAEGNLIVYGHYGRPVLAFPSEQGSVFDYEDRGMIESVAHLIETGRAKLYCIDSFDSLSWHRDDLSLEGRAQLHTKYEDYIVQQVVPWIHNDCGGPLDIMTTGCSFGAYHAANCALKRADLFPLALCMSGLYDLSQIGDGERGEDFYFNNPMDYVSHFGGDHLAWIRHRVHLVLVCGQGMWEDTTGALDSTRAFAGLLADKGLPHELDLWGHDVPHDWPSWRNQLAHHLPRFC